MNRVVGISWRVTYSTWWLIVCVASFIYTTPLTQLQTVQFPYPDSWEVFKECGEGGVGGYSPGQCILHDSATTTTCSKTLITYITVTVPARDIQNSRATVSKRRGRKKRQCSVPVSPVRILISVRLLRTRCHLHFQWQSMQI